MQIENQLSNGLSKFFLPFCHFYEDNSNNKQAAVLILLRQENRCNISADKSKLSGINKKKWSLLLTVRSKFLRRHPGEVCFPGGMRDLNFDKTPVETAVRETYEEIGLPSIFIRVLGTLPPFMSLHQVQLFPVLAIIEPIQERLYQAKFSDEVEAFFWAPLENFLSTDGHQTFEIQGTDTLMHTFSFGEYVVFGITSILCVAISIGILQKLPSFKERVHSEKEDAKINTVETILKAMFRYFGKDRGYIEPKIIKAALPSKL